MKDAPADPAVCAAVQIELQKRSIEEFEQLFDMRWKADMRAIKRWQEATGKTLTWPDHADLCVWLLEQLDAVNQQSQVQK